MLPKAAEPKLPLGLGAGRGVGDVEQLGAELQLGLREAGNGGDNVQMEKLGDALSPVC
jgi:hypothetical protein